MAAGFDQAVDGLDHVDGNADRAALVGDGARDGLPDPPGRIGAELVAFAVVELLHGADQADVAFLNEIGKGHAAQRVAFGDGDDQPQVGLGQNGFGVLIAALDALGKADFFGQRQQMGPPDFAQPHAHGVVERHPFQRRQIFRRESRPRRAAAAVAFLAQRRRTPVRRRGGRPGASSSRKCRTSSTGCPPPSAAPSSVSAPAFQFARARFARSSRVGRSHCCPYRRHSHIAHFLCRHVHYPSRAARDFGVPFSSLCSRANCRMRVRIRRSVRICCFQHRTSVCSLARLSDARSRPPAPRRQRLIPLFISRSASKICARVVPQRRQNFFRVQRPRLLILLMQDTVPAPGPAR